MGFKIIKKSTHAALEITINKRMAEIMGRAGLSGKPRGLPPREDLGGPDVHEEDK